MAATAGPDQAIRKETGNAVLEIETAPGKTEKFVCQFNPTEYTIAADGSLESFKTIGSQQDMHQVSVGNAQTLSLHLMFDISSILEFGDDTGKKVKESKEEDISPYMNMLLGRDRRQDAPSAVGAVCMGIDEFSGQGEEHPRDLHDVWDGRDAGAQRGGSGHHRGWQAGGKEAPEPEEFA